MQAKVVVKHRDAGLGRPAKTALVEQRKPRVATARANHNLPDNSRRFLAEQSQPEAQVQVAVKYGLHGP